MSFHLHMCRMPADQKLRGKVEYGLKTLWYTHVVPGHTDYPRTSFEAYLSFLNKLSLDFHVKAGFCGCLLACLFLSFGT